MRADDGMIAVEPKPNAHDGNAQGRAGDAAATSSAPPVIQQPGPKNGPLTRPFAIAHCLAAFMNRDSIAQHLPLASSLPVASLRGIEDRFGRAAGLDAVPRAGLPQFTRVTEPSVLQLLEMVAQHSTQASLNNLVGFEWVEISPLIAGRLVTEAAPWAESIPDRLDADALAKVCLFSSAKIPQVTVSLSLAGGPKVVTPVRVDVVPLGYQTGQAEIDGIDAIVLNAQFVIRPAVQPIQVLIANGRTIALSGLARLVALQERGVDRALCAVSYGYGQDAVTMAPTIGLDLIDSVRPPLVTDFLDASLSVQIPVRAETNALAVLPQLFRN